MSSEKVRELMVSLKGLLVLCLELVEPIVLTNFAVDLGLAEVSDLVVRSKHALNVLTTVKDLSFRVVLLLQGFLMGFLVLLVKQRVDFVGKAIFSHLEQRSRL